MADALSRNPQDENTEQTLNAITNNNWYENKKTEVEGNPHSETTYKIINGKLYHYLWDQYDYKEPEMSNPWKLCVPPEMKNNLISENHNEPTSGHLGIAKTISKMSRNYFWPGLARDVAKFVRECKCCQKYKPEQKKTPGKMYDTEIPIGPWTILTTDIIGPLTRSSAGNKYLIVYQDKFTKWIECHPVRNITANIIVKSLKDKIILKFGCPKKIITDNASQFTNRKFKQFLQDYKIKKQTIPPYSPQNNPVERANKTVKTMIAQFCEINQKSWDSYIPELTFAANTSRHESTGFTPAFLNFGRELNKPSRVWDHENPEGSDAFTEEQIDLHNKSLEKLKESFELVKLNLAKTFSTQKHYYNLRRREWIPKLGEQVMKKEHNISDASKGITAKLLPKYSGPLTVTKVWSPVIFQLKDTHTGKTFKKIHVKDLKPAH